MFKALFGDILADLDIDELVGIDVDFDDFFSELKGDGTSQVKGNGKAQADFQKVMHQHAGKSMPKKDAFLNLLYVKDLKSIKLQSNAQKLRKLEQKVNSSLLCIENLQNKVCEGFASGKAKNNSKKAGGAHKNKAAVQQDKLFFRKQLDDVLEKNARAACKDSDSLLRKCDAVAGLLEDDEAEHMKGENKDHPALLLLQETAMEFVDAQKKDPKNLKMYQSLRKHVDVLNEDVLSKADLFWGVDTSAGDGG